ncbi:SGNH/GDSL hydrolase family protein [Paenibacillus spiritus]|uniref:SGNH/GDSL hydrolase family protein n=1 Tax=Paenibacillus spiritus TaxID=2496557 RepID=A0A5J5G8C8_9BACL|nr:MULTISPECIES: SGNH/GDSL hydrolase family protein [Paenibacillus]KAA9003957.1 SGNH/GDSL hydrolase family protein [Paenibacillus spiritus]
MLLQDHDIIVFQGDSITDAGRDRTDSESLGHGYPLLLASALGRLYPEKKLTFYNRGIGGDRATDLQSRWEEDALALKPTVLSLYIGINDTWRRYDEGEETTAEAFERSYRDLLDRTLAAGDVRLILLEPFVLQVPGLDREWRSDLDPKIAVVRKLAREYGARLVPLDGLFNAAALADPAYWAADGVHPTPAGHALIAEAWMKAAGIR